MKKVGVLLKKSYLLVCLFALFVGVFFAFSPLKCEAESWPTLSKMEWIKYFNTEQTNYVRVVEDESIERIVFLSRNDSLPDRSLPSLRSYSGIYAYYNKSIETVYIYTEYSTIQLGEDCSEMFQNFKKLKEIQFGDKIDASRVKNVERMFDNCNSLEKLDLSRLRFEKIEKMQEAFRSCYNLKEIKFGIFNTSKVKTMERVFCRCDSLEALDLSCFDTSNVTSMRSMFSSCKKLKSIDFANKFDTSNVTDMYRMFEQCESLENVDLSGMDTSNVTKMYRMFAFCKSLKSAKLNFDTKKVTDMQDLFYCCENLKYLDISSFEIYSNCSTGDFFQGNVSLEVILSPQILANSISLSYYKMPEFYIDDDNDGKADTERIYMALDSASVSHRYVSKKKQRSSKNAYTNFPGEAFIFQGNGTSHCVVSSAAMMIKNRLYMNSDQSYKNVTKENVMAVAVDRNGDQRNIYTYFVDGKSFNIDCKRVTTKDELIDLLDLHPEGIVLYAWRKDNNRNQHAVLLTKCADGVFYCVDPGVNKFAETPLRDSTLIKGRYSSEDAFYNDANIKIWFIESCNLSAPVGKDSSETAKVNSGDKKKEIGNTFYIGKNKYTITKDGEIMLIGVAGKTPNFTIPAEVKREGEVYKVTKIGDNAFKNDKNLKKLTIGSNVTSIGKNAFSGCKNLKSIRIKTTSLTKKTVGKNAFKGLNKNAKVKVPKSVLKSYQKILKAKGLNGKSQKITK